MMRLRRTMMAKRMRKQGYTPSQRMIKYLGKKISRTVPFFQPRLANSRLSRVRYGPL
jgi:hypothetical protein